MKYLFDVSIIVATLVVMLIAYNSNYFSYKNCMSQTKIWHYHTKRCRTYSGTMQSFCFG